MDHQRSNAEMDAEMREMREMTGSMLSFQEEKSFFEPTAFSAMAGSHGSSPTGVLC
jgi:hypothetical protein